MRENRNRKGYKIGQLMFDRYREFDRDWETVPRTIEQGRGGPPVPCDIICDII